jgi:hypothetical protein
MDSRRRRASGGGVRWLGVKFDRFREVDRDPRRQSGEAGRISQIDVDQTSCRFSANRDDLTISESHGLGKLTHVRHQTMDQRLAELHLSAHHAPLLLRHGLPLRW